MSTETKDKTPMKKDVKITLSTKITIPREEEFELTERKFRIWEKGNLNGFFKGFVLGLSIGACLVFIIYSITNQ